MAAPFPPAPATAPMAAPARAPFAAPRAAPPLSSGAAWAACAGLGRAVAGGAILAFAPRADDVGGAVLVGAEECPAALDAFLLAGFGWIERAGGPTRIARDGTGARQARVIVRAVPVAHPFPSIPGDVVE